MQTTVRRAYAALSTTKTKARPPRRTARTIINPLSVHSVLPTTKNSFFENPNAPSFNSEYLYAAMDMGDVEFIHELQNDLREKLPTPSSDKQELNAQIRHLLATLGWADEAFDMVVDTSYRNGILRASWLEFQTRSFIAHGEPENALRIFAYLVQNLNHGRTQRSPTPSLTVNILNTILRHEITIPYQVLEALTEVLERYPTAMPSRTTKAMVEVYARRNAHHHLKRIIKAWSANPSLHSPIVLGEIASFMIRSAEAAGDHKTANAWYGLHRDMSSAASQLLQKQQQALSNAVQAVQSQKHLKPDSYNSQSIVLDATPYVTIAQYRLRQRPRRPWRVVKQMLGEVTEDGVPPNTSMYNLILRTARAGGRYDRVFQFFEHMCSQNHSPAVVPDAYTFCTMWKCLDDTRRRSNIYQSYSNRPSGTQLFQLMLSANTHHTFSSNLSPESRLLSLSTHHARPSSPSSITKGSLNLALAYFMKSHEYGNALAVLRVFETFNIRPNIRTRWSVETAILRRAIGELGVRLRSGFITQGLSAGHDGEEHEVYSTSSSLSWPELLTGMSAEVPELSDQRERWSRLKSTRAYVMRQQVLERMVDQLEKQNFHRPRFVPKGTSPVLKEVFAIAGRCETQSSGHAISVGHDTHASDVDGQRDNAQDVSSAVDLRALMDVVGRCALASEGIGANADIQVQEDVLARLIEDAEARMLPSTVEYHVATLRRRESRKIQRT